MKLIIKDICKIRSAEIELDGITIIAGDNNTGKSTTGKVLFALFNSLSSLSDKVYEERINECYRILRSYSRYYNMRAPRSKELYDAHAVAKQLVDNEKTVEEAVNELRIFRQSIVDSWTTDSNQKIVYSRLPEADWDLIIKHLEEILGISDEDYQSQLVMNSFNDVFNNQIQPLFKDAKNPIAKMIIKGKELSVTFTPEKACNICQLELHSKPYFFDNPAQLEELGQNVYDFTSEQINNISNSFTADAQPSETILLRKKYEDIGAQLTTLLEGKLVYEDSEFRFASSNPNITDRLKLKNLSQGVKSIAMLQAAFSNGAIKDGDVLILDEPEIHLHPAWQVKYAEFIVLLQKAFHLTVLLTSHSPDFIEAIRLYSRAHNTDDKLKGYISVLQDDGMVTFEKVDNWDKIFTKFADSFRSLMKLRKELEAQKND